MAEAPNLLIDRPVGVFQSPAATGPCADIPLARRQELIAAQSACSLMRCSYRDIATRYRRRQGSRGSSWPTSTSPSIVACAARRRSKGSRCAAAISPAVRTCATVTGKISNPASSMCRSKSRSRSRASGHLPQTDLDGDLPCTGDADYNVILLRLQRCARSRRKTCAIHSGPEYDMRRQVAVPVRKLFVGDRLQKACGTFILPSSNPS